MSDNGLNVLQAMVKFEKQGATTQQVMMMLRNTMTCAKIIHRDMRYIIILNIGTERFYDFKWCHGDIANMPYLELQAIRKALHICSVHIHERCVYL